MESRIGPHAQGHSGCSNQGIRISKRIEVKSSDGKLTESFIPRIQAVREVREFRSDWDSDEQNYVIRRPRSQQGKLGVWKPVQSGWDGPLVLQFV